MDAPSARLLIEMQVLRLRAAPFAQDDKIGDWEILGVEDGMRRVRWCWVRRDVGERLGSWVEAAGIAGILPPLSSFGVVRMTHLLSLFDPTLCAIRLRKGWVPGDSCAVSQVSSDISEAPTLSLSQSLLLPPSPCSPIPRIPFRGRSRRLFRLRPGCSLFCL